MDLKDFMRQAGAVIRADIPADESGRSKGYGIVDFASPQDANQAIRTLNDRELDGRRLNIRENREPRGTAGAGGFASYTNRAGGSSLGSTKVFVNGLSFSTAWQELKDHMRQAGNVLHVDIKLAPDGRSKGNALVEYSSPQEALNAMRMLDNSELEGRTIFVREDRDAVKAPVNGRGTAGGGFKVFVGNLSFRTTWQDLKDHMRQVGDVNHVEIHTDASGLSKGSALVEFSSRSAARAAIDRLQDSELGGRPLFIREDRDAAGGSSGGSRGGGGGNGNTRVYVGNLDWSVKWQDLKDFCRQAGPVLKADVMEGEDGRSKGWGLVQFEKPADAFRACSILNDQPLCGRPVIVHEDRDTASTSRQDAPGARRGEEGCKLFVGNLNFKTGWQDLKDHMRQAGVVAFVDIPLNEQGQSKGWGLVRYDEREDALRAIQTLNGTILDDRTIEVRQEHRS